MVITVWSMDRKKIRILSVETHDMIMVTQVAVQIDTKFLMLVGHRTRCYEVDEGEGLESIWRERTGPQVVRWCCRSLNSK
jgi:hypothetical protein